MTANVWSPNSTTVPQMAANSTRRTELQAATDGQRAFSLTTFAYEPNTGSIQVAKNGELLDLNEDFFEIDSTRILLTVPCVQGDKISFVGFVAITAVTTTDPILRADLGAGTGSAIIGYSQSYAGAVSRKSQYKLRERVSVADFLDDLATPTVTQITAAVQAAINSLAATVKITKAYTINQPITLVANQILDFDGGSLIVDPSLTVATDGILIAISKSNVTIVNPVLDLSSVSTSLTGINFTDSPGSSIEGGVLTKCGVAFSSTNTATRMGYKIKGTFFNGSGLVGTAIYISSANNVTLSDVELTNCKEGVGIYNGASNIKHSQVASYGHTQDGFVIINGTRISYTGCQAYSNGQSGFTTQRQSAGTNVSKVSYSNCHAYDNTFDGFDIRGADVTPWGVDIQIRIDNCISGSNTGTGFYIVNAEGTKVVGCTAVNNQAQNFFVNTSSYVQLVSCTSISGASIVGAGGNKAGILVYNSNDTIVNCCDSGNYNGGTQDYGISFTGTSTRGQVVGGNYENNITAPYSLPTSGVRVSGAQAEISAGVGIFLKSISFLGIYEEEGFGVPTHIRPKGSTFNRTDGGGAEMYITHGAGVWKTLLMSA